MGSADGPIDAVILEAAISDRGRPKADLERITCCQAPREPYAIAAGTPWRGLDQQAGSGSESALTGSKPGAPPEGWEELSALRRHESTRTSHCVSGLFGIV